MKIEKELINRAMRQFAFESPLFLLKMPAAEVTPTSIFASPCMQKRIDFFVGLVYTISMIITYVNALSMEHFCQGSDSL